MCTIIALRAMRSDYPLVLATNRDEFYARPAAGPKRLLEQPVAVGGLDLAALGAWMGVTREGVFVGVTNQRTYLPPDRSKRSRGELVLHALSLREPARIRAYIETLDGRAYNSFNLMFGDASALHVAYGRSDTRGVEIEPVPEGLHVLPNDRLDAPEFLKVARARELVAPFAAAPWPELEGALERALRDDTLPPLEALPDPPPHAPFDKPLLQRLAALNVRTPNYGTCSSTIVALRSGAVGHYLYADGPPPHTPFADVTTLF